MFEAAKALAGDGELLVIINNDNWLRKKKGYVFMPEKERLEIVRALRCVNLALVTFHRPDDPRTDVCKELQTWWPDVFANGGDRGDQNTPELELCRHLGITCVFNVGGGKVQSSSDLVKASHESRA